MSNEKNKRKVCETNSYEDYRSLFAPCYAKIACMIREKVLELLREKGIENPILLTPKNTEFGDYSLNTHQLKTKINLHDFENPLFEKIEEKAGFINFFISSKILLEEAKQMMSNEEYGKTELYKNKKVMVEYTDPNPFKEFHIGHLFTNIIGESLARLYEEGGAVVKRANYEGDVGMHVAKSVWGMLQLKDEMPEDTTPLREKAKYLGKAYAFGASQFDNEKAKEEITEINKKIYAQDASIFPLYLKGRQWSLDYFEEIYKQLGTKFDFYYFESEIGKVGQKIVEAYYEKGIFKRSEGAIVFPGEDYGLHTRVFINSLGLPTYEAKELGLAPTKYNDFPYDVSIVITGNEIDNYFKVLLCALQQIRPDLAEKTIHLSHGMVRAADGSKMSSRSGKVMTGELLLEEAQEAVLKIINTEYSEEEKKTISQAVAVAAIKYAFLKNSIGKDLSFDLEKSISFTGDSGPYLQYTYARCKSILRKSKEAFSIPENYNFKTEELFLLKRLTQFPQIVEESIIKKAPHLLCTYLFDVTQQFNVFYEHHQVLSAEDIERKMRLSLVEGTAKILKTGLHLLGIKTLEKI